MKTVLIVISIIVLAVALWAGLAGNLSVLTVGFLAFVVLLFVANLDRIAEFKASGTGIEAKTRDILSRAEVTLKELQLLAKQVATVTLSLVKRSGRLGGYTDNEEDTVKTSVLNTLRQVGIPESDFPEILAEWHKFTKLDYAHAILGGFTIPDRAEKEVVNEWTKLQNGDLNNIPMPQDIRAFLLKHGYMTPELEDRINDYEHYLQSYLQRRPEVWRDRRNWGRLKKT